MCHANKGASLGDHAAPQDVKQKRQMLRDTCEYFYDRIMSVPSQLCPMQLLQHVFGLLQQLGCARKYSAVKVPFYSR